MRQIDQHVKNPVKQIYGDQTLACIVVGKRLFSAMGQYVGYFNDSLLHSETGKIIGYKFRRGNWIYDNKGQPIYQVRTKKRKMKA